MIIKTERYSLREGREAWETGGSESERRRQGGPAACDRGQVRVGTCFALNEDEVSCLPVVR